MPSDHSPDLGEHARPGGVRRLLSALLLCLGLAAASLAAVSGSGDPTGAVVSMARAHVGDSYVWAGNGPRAWDCSGFTSALWRDAGGVRDIPRTSRQQQAWTVPVPLAQVRPGDLVFFGDPVTHVGLVLHRAGTRVTMIDASSSQRGVVQRLVWSSPNVRYGRVPRPGMVPVVPVPADPAPIVQPTDHGPSPEVADEPADVPDPIPAATPVSTQEPLSSRGVRSFVAVGAPRGLGTGEAVTPTAARAVRLARAAVGNRHLSDIDLVRNVWRRAGGPALGPGRAGLAAAAHRIPLAQARAGDLVVYPDPAAHVGLYLGDGQMVDGSRALRSVVLRAVWSARGVQVHRLRS